MFLRTLTSHGYISTGCCVVLLYVGTSWLVPSVRVAYHGNLTIHIQELRAEQDIATDE